jgi:hypothetical protein
VDIFVSENQKVTIVDGCAKEGTEVLDSGLLIILDENMLKK